MEYGAQVGSLGIREIAAQKMAKPGKGRATWFRLAPAGGTTRWIGSCRDRGNGLVGERAEPFSLLAVAA